MRWLLSTLPLLLVSASDDAQARELYSGLRKKMETAQTLSMDFAITVTTSGGPSTMTGSVRLKGPERWWIQLQPKDGRPLDKVPSMTLFSDGTQVSGLGRSNVELDPKETAARLRRTLPDTFLLFSMVFASKRPSQDIVPPKEDAVRDGGTETIDGVAARIVLYDLEAKRDKFQVKAWIDPAGPRLLKRELSLEKEQVRITEIVSQWSIDAPIPDSVFTFASVRRLALARAKQVGRSAMLYGLYTGRTPATLEDLLARPKGLPEAAIWPAGGFFLGSVLPKDPWGNPFALKAEGTRLIVTSSGADGKPGGSGDDEDIAAEVPFSLRMVVTGPTPRLRNHYEARITLQLIVAAVKAYRETYGQLPRKKADLFDKPESGTVWPEGGWIPGKKMPVDPWGEEFRLITEVQSARVQVQDPKARTVTLKMLTDEEKAALERSGKPELTAAEQLEIEALVKDLRDDDLETRQKAQNAMRRYGPAIDETLTKLLAVEQDAEAKSRMLDVRKSLPRPVPPWRFELASLSVGIYGDGQPANIASNERVGSTTLKTFASAEADFRANDRDWNHVNDFWTADVAGLYTVKDDSGNSIKLIELSAALADGAPAEAGLAGGKLPALSGFGVSAPKAGYWFRAMESTAEENPAEALRQDTGGKPEMGKVHHTSRFGFCAYPAEYGVSGLRTFIISEYNTIFWKDTQGEPVLEWPSEADLREWTKLD